MIEFDITEEAKSLLKLLYTLYLSRRAEGKGRTKANYFNDSESIQKDYLPSMAADDVTELCFELADAGCIIYCPGNNMANDISLSRDGLVYCEQAFKRNLKILLEWVSDIKGVLPFC